MRKAPASAKKIQRPPKIVRHKTADQNATSWFVNGWFAGIIPQFESLRRFERAIDQLHIGGYDLIRLLDLLESRIVNLHAAGNPRTFHTRGVCATRMFSITTFLATGL